MGGGGIYQCLAEVVIVNKKGLHARASMAFVRMVEKFDAEVSVTKDSQTVSGSSIMGLLMLGGKPRLYDPDRNGGTRRRTGPGSVDRACRGWLP